MGHFTYYWPGKAIVTNDDLVAENCSYMFDGPAEPHRVEVLSGPDGNSGCAFTAPNYDGDSPPPKVDGLDWAPIPGKPLWLGVDPEDLPGPADLVRPWQFDGYDVRLGDGRLWRLPVARAVDGSTTLPRKLAWDGSSWQPGDVLPLYRELFAAAAAVWDTLLAAGEGKAARVTLSDECDLVTRALACNYRVGPAEVSALGLLTSEVEIEAVRAVIDWPGFTELKKKLRAEPARP